MSCVKVLDFYMFQRYLLCTMAITVDDLTYTIDDLDPNRKRIVVSIGPVELGTLYFEKAKVGFTNKPIGLNAWACVDAKIEDLYVHNGDTITPKDVVGKCQRLIAGDNRKISEVGQ